MTAQIKLTWTDVNTSEEGFRIYRSDSPIDTSNPPAPLVELSPTEEGEYIDDTVVHGNEYYYVISSYNTEGDEEFGQEIRVLCDEVVYAGLGNRRVGSSSGYYGKIRSDLTNSMQFIDLPGRVGAPRSVDVCPVTKNIALAAGIRLYYNYVARIVVYDQEGNLLLDDTETGDNYRNGNTIGVMAHFSSTGDLFVSYLAYDEDDYSTDDGNYEFSILKKYTLNADQVSYTFDSSITYESYCYKMGISPDGTTVFTCDQKRNRITKFNISDLSVIDRVGGDIYDENSNLIAQIYNPNAVAVDGNGYVFVSCGYTNEDGTNNNNNSRIIKFTSSLIPVWTVDDTIGKHTSHIMTDGTDGTIYVLKGAFETTSGDSLVEKYDTDGNLLWSSPKFPVGTAADMVIGLSGDVYVCTAAVRSNSTSNSKIYRLNPSDGTIKKEGNEGINTRRGESQVVASIAVDPSKQVMAMGAREA